MKRSHENCQKQTHRTVSCRISTGLMGGLNQGVTVIKSIKSNSSIREHSHLPQSRTKVNFSPESMEQRPKQGNVKLCVTNRSRAVTVSVLCPVIVLCCRCACMCINVRLVIYGIS